MNSFAPLSTARLTLRPMRSEDADAIAQRRSDPNVARYAHYTSPYSTAQAADIIAAVSDMAGPTEGKWWMLAVVRGDADGEVIGNVSLFPTMGGRSVEIGWELGAGAWGFGYATEAAEALVSYLFDPNTRVGPDGPVHRISAKMHPDNLASARVAEALGMQWEGQTRGSYWVGDQVTDNALYGMTRSDWIDWINRPADRPRVVELVPITDESVEMVGQLRVHHSQENYVAPVPRSYGNALYPQVIDGVPVDPWLRAVVADGELVGFVMCAEETETFPDPYLWRFLIDRRHQRRGIGRLAMDKLVQHWREMGYDTVSVSWVEGPGSPEKFYLRMGFEPTGIIVDDEVEGELTLADYPN